MKTYGEVNSSMRSFNLGTRWRPAEATLHSEKKKSKDQCVQDALAQSPLEVTTMRKADAPAGATNQTDRDIKYYQPITLIAKDEGGSSH
jgi:hypothetical protein